MSTIVKLAALVGVIASVTACGRNDANDDVVIVEPAPVMAEPVSGKF